ncbi:peptidoglycan-associated lipoprotein Pal [Ferrovibrio terrae]|uniref:peptidoglycan-associated lipoprotein Pal n=1 Tax=Ferrovibrio terrae TaxID=2594003 RepID=UPI0031377410
MQMRNWAIRSAMAATLALALVACETAPQPAGSVSGSGRPGSAATGGTGSAAGVSGMPLTREDAQRQFAADVGDRVLFATDSYALDAASTAILERQVAWLKRNAQWRLVIEGHADERGTREYNLALGDRRATSIRNYLVNQGIPTQRISTLSYGKERPSTVGSNEAAWAQNRRGVTVLAN